MSSNEFNIGSKFLEGLGALEQDLKGIQALDQNQVKTTLEVTREKVHEMLADKGFQQIPAFAEPLHDLERTLEEIEARFYGSGKGKGEKVVRQFREDDLDEIHSHIDACRKVVAVQDEQRLNEMIDKSLEYGDLETAIRLYGLLPDTQLALNSCFDLIREVPDPKVQNKLIKNLLSTWEKLKGESNRSRILLESVFQFLFEIKPVDYQTALNISKKLQGILQYSALEKLISSNPPHDILEQALTEARKEEEGPTFQFLAKHALEADNIKGCEEYLKLANRRDWTFLATYLITEFDPAGKSVAHCEQVYKMLSQFLVDPKYLRELLKTDAALSKLLGKDTEGLWDTVVLSKLEKANHEGLKDSDFLNVLSDLDQKLRSDMLASANDASREPGNKEMDAKKSADKEGRDKAKS